MIWRPNKKQEIALKLRKVKELFYGGARGGGKTAFLLADFLAGANEWGENWNGIFFRRSYTELEEVVRQAKRMYFPLGAEYHKAENFFSFPNGTTLRLSYLESDSDCERYQGHEYSWIGFDELGNYRTDYAWTMMMMCLRSSRIDGEWLRIRGTGNPGGVGHKWLKQRFVEGREPCKVYSERVGTDA
ncbi:MAG: terminase family protein, partial [Spirochaetaceae bacterium]|nr:terminase family protein [Spirochaetaceae bacterium]